MEHDEVSVSRSALTAALVRAGLAESAVEQVLHDLTVTKSFETGGRSRGAVVLYYLGGLLVIGAMSVFLGESWSEAGDAAGLAVLLLYAVAFAVLAIVFRQRGLPTPSGLMATAVVALVPAVVFAFSRTTGVGEGTDYADYADFYVWVSSQWFLMELATIAVGVVALRLTDFSLVLAVMGTSMYFAAMDLTEVVFSDDPTDGQRALVAIAIGFVAIAIGVAFDHQPRRDHAFWPHLFGVLSVLWGIEFALAGAGESSQWVATEALGLVFLAFGTVAARVTYVAIGGLLVFGATSWAALDLFQSSLLTPLAIAVIGLMIIAGGVWLQRNAVRLQANVRGALPAWMLKLVPLTPEEQGRFLRRGD